MRILRLKKASNSEEADEDDKPNEGLGVLDNAEQDNNAKHDNADPEGEVEEVDQPQLERNT
ncbi:hypothetical protein KY285_030161 [Solanum tuberosum]|nr:hypothetical protein KY289_030301 [Solanum tuberosum]KAH0655279.1 hypothetical protein KY285_030161 [Solanum tuberosum]